jgi:hypothetical protein
MLDFAWDQYRGWALVARQLQKSSRVTSVAALALGVIAALCGAAAAVVPADGTDLGLRTWLSFAAALAAGLAAIPVLRTTQTERETQQIRARATAEAIKSECFRYAAGAKPYSGAVGRAQADRELRQRIEELNQQAAEDEAVWQEAPSSGAPDQRKPPLPMTMEWYNEKRLRDQIRWYQMRQADHQRAIGWLRGIGIACAGASVSLGVAGGITRGVVLTPWIGFMTTLSASVAAFGLLDRRKFLGATYSTRQSRLRAIEALARDEQMPLPELVQQTEELLQAEHAAWVREMRRVGQRRREDPGGRPGRGAAAAAARTNKRPGVRAR